MTNSPGIITANLACFVAMFMWAFAFPASEVLLQTWGVMALILVRTILAVSTLTVIWLWVDGFSKLRLAPWFHGLKIGGIGFGIGAILLLVGQKMSDPVTPAIAAAMMPIAGAAVEVVLDKRMLKLHLIVAIVLAFIGGIFAGGVNLNDVTFGIGALFCLIAIVLFAWVTHATTNDLKLLSPIGQTAITLIGCLTVVLVAYIVSVIIGVKEYHIGLTGVTEITLLIVMAVASIALAQLLWIWGAGGLGILLASLHMNIAPFYVMAIVVIFMGDQWNWSQALGAALVGIAVLIAQSKQFNKFSTDKV
ncbi:DMT family transporter [Paracoccaceae bacterium]|nr:DMT family transporter [Paracoccaceae bacterium]